MCFLRRVWLCVLFYEPSVVVSTARVRSSLGTVLYCMLWCFLSLLCCQYVTLMYSSYVVGEHLQIQNAGIKCQNIIWLYIYNITGYPILVLCESALRCSRSTRPPRSWPALSRPNRRRRRRLLLREFRVSAVSVAPPAGARRRGGTTDP